MTEPTRIWTIGYEGVTQAEMIASLKSADIELLIDVRAVPLSRRPGFSKNILGVYSRGVVIWVDFESAWVFYPDTRDIFVRGEAA